MGRAQGRGRDAATRRRVTTESAREQSNRTWVVAKLIEHYGEKQKNLAVNFAAEVDEITNPGHHKIVSDLLDKGEWQKAAKAYYCQDTSTEVFKKVLEAPLAGEACMEKVTQRDLVGRNVPTDRRIPLSDEAALQSFPANCVLLLAGESGSGKTWHVLSSLPPFLCTKPHQAQDHLFTAGFYMTSSELTIFSQWVTANKNNPPTNTTKEKMTRNEHAVEAVMNVLKLRFPDDAGSTRLLSHVDRLVIAIDECGGCPDLIRALCSKQSALEERISTWINDASQQTKEAKVEVRIILVGTGVDASSAAPGSFPETYRIVRMPPCTNFFDTVWPKDTRTGIQQAVAASQRAKNMQVNRRLAALVVNTVGSLGQQYAMIPRESIHVIVPALLHVAMHAFKLKNGFSSETARGISWFFLQTLRLAMNVCSEKVEAEARSLLSNKLGVLTDEAQWMDKNRATAEHCVVEREGAVVLAYKKQDGRFRVTAAQMELFAARFGLGPIPPTWTGFELAVGYFVTLALHACNGGSMRDLVGLFRPDRFDIRSKPGPGTEEDKDENEKLQYDGVTMVQLKTKIESESSVAEALAQKTKDGMGTENEWRRSKSATVMLNGPAAAFADVIALVPDCALLLVQCKCYSAATPFGEREALAELFKMGLNTPRTAIAHFAENVDRAFLQSEKFASDTTVPGTLKQQIAKSRKKHIPRSEIFSTLITAFGESGQHAACATEFGCEYAARRLGAIDALRKHAGSAKRVVRILATTQEPILGLTDGLTDVLQVKVSKQTMYPVPLPDGWQPSAAGFVDVLVNLSLEGAAAVEA